MDKNLGNVFSADGFEQQQQAEQNVVRQRYTKALSQRPPSSIRQQQPPPPSPLTTQNDDNRPLDKFARVINLQGQCDFSVLTPIVRDAIKGQINQAENEVSYNMQLDRQMNQFLSPVTIAKQVQKFHSLIFFSVSKSPNDVELIRQQLKRFHFKMSAQQVIKSCIRNKNGTLQWIKNVTNNLSLKDFIQDVVNNIRSWGSSFIHLGKVKHCGQKIKQTPQYTVYRVFDVTVVDVQIARDSQSLKVYVDGKLMQPSSFIEKFIIPKIKQKQQKLVNRLYVQLKRKRRLLFEKQRDLDVQQQLNNDQYEKKSGIKRVKVEYS